MFSDDPARRRHKPTLVLRCLQLFQNFGNWRTREFDVKLGVCQGERLAPLRPSLTPDDPGSAQQANALVLRALNLRLASLGLWTLLWLEHAASDADLRPLPGSSAMKISFAWLTGI